MHTMGQSNINQHQTLVTNLYDKLLEHLHNEKEIALLILDQSKAYDLVQHQILLQKLGSIRTQRKVTQPN